MMLSFSKYQASGNDFIVIDDRSLIFPIHDFEFIQRLCHRQLGIGADGVILLQNARSAHFRMRIFNADGNEPEMCGNGLRCLARFIRALGHPQDSIYIDTGHSIVKCQIEGEKIVVFQLISTPFAEEIRLSLNDGMEKVWFIHTGVPHAIVFKDDVDQVPIERIGSEIRSHERFGPQGTNVNFASIRGDEVHVRTYERGVGETLACGTGAVAVALTVHQKNNQMKSPITIIPLSKERIEVGFSEMQANQREVQVAGNASFVFEGRIYRKLNS